MKIKNIIYLATLIMLYIVLMYEFLIKSYKQLSMSDIIEYLQSKKISFFVEILLISLFIFILNYEAKSKKVDIISFVTLIIILVSLFGVIVYDNSHLLHSLFAGLMFVMMICYSINHCFNNTDSYSLWFLLYLQILCLFLIILSIDSYMFIPEMAFITFFFFYFVTLHFI